MNIDIVPFEEGHAQDISNLIIRNFYEVNIKDYSLEEITLLAQRFTPDDILGFSRWRSILVALEDGVPVGTAGQARISENPVTYVLLSVFVRPDSQGKGIGKILIQALESRARAQGAKKLLVPASITACEFYLKMGYHYQNGIKELDSDRLYPMEKDL